MFPEAFAREIAEDLLNDLSPFCNRIEIVGSLRRHKMAVNDIDLIAIPKLLQLDDDTLFGEPVQENLLDRKLSQMCLSTDLALEANGTKIKRFTKTVDGDFVPIDIYVSIEQTWWTLLLIRTGSRNHNVKLARKAIDLGMHLKADGSGLLAADGSLIQIYSEEGIFRHLGLQYRPPEERD
jgi:DNA polymerase/3'-5' exonuclease PolX